MDALAQLRSLDHQQRSAVIASFLGWTLDAFDFFLLVFVLKDVAAEFGTDVKSVTWAITLTLAMRPVGAFVFGLIADRYGRRPTLMADIILYSVIELASAFSPSLTVLVLLRALYGIAMGGEWGIGASLAMETIPPGARGVVSGILQEGYAAGYLLAAVVFSFLFPLIGWRGMFVVGVLPALLVLYIRIHVKESPAWERSRQRRESALGAIRERWPLFLYVVLLMTAFNFMSHGTQDLYPTFLRVQHHLPSETVGTVLIISNIGAIIGGIVFGTWSERIGRRYAIMIAAALVLPIIPLWALSQSVWQLALGAFLIQIMVQGAWGIIPVHLNELSPEAARGTFPGFAYQLGNLLAAINATLQSVIAESHGDDYSLALASVAAVVAVAVVLFAWVGRERKSVAFGAASPAE
jgi:MFS transporter, SHS family, lactate transporter